MNTQPEILSVKKIIPTIISVSMFMEGVDMTIINTAIPYMARSMQINPIDLKIALISYLLSLAIFIPISGWLADKFGVKKYFSVHYLFLLQALYGVVWQIIYQN